MTADPIGRSRLRHDPDAWGTAADGVDDETLALAAPREWRKARAERDAVARVPRRWPAAPVPVAAPAPSPAPAPAPAPDPAEIQAARAATRARAVRARWRKAIRTVIRQNRFYASANKDNAAAAEAGVIPVGANRLDDPAVRYDTAAACDRYA